MSKTSDNEALLRACIQDLAGGKRLLARHAASLAGQVTDPALRETIARIGTTAAAQTKRLRATGLAEGGPANLWMAGILDDAARDARTVAPGPLLDVALIGALRKARAAETVSDDTAIALAEAMGRTDVRETVTAIRAEQQASDEALAARLAPLAQVAARLTPRPGIGAGPMAAGGVVALGAAALVTGWAYWMRQDRARARRTRERLLVSRRG